MSDQRPNETTPLEPGDARPGTSPTPSSTPSSPPPSGLPPADPAPTSGQLAAPGNGKLPHTRTGAAWAGIWAAAVFLVLLIIFILQNTGNVQVNFLWMEGSLPLALALLIAGVGVGLATMVVGAARVTQLRRQLRRH